MQHLLEIHLETIRVGSKDKLLVPKLDGLHKHIGRRKCILPKPRYKVGEFYISVDNQHVKKRGYMALHGLLLLLA